MYATLTVKVASEGDPKSTHVRSFRQAYCGLSSATVSSKCDDVDYFPAHSHVDTVNVHICLIRVGHGRLASGIPLETLCRVQVLTCATVRPKGDVPSKGSRASGNHSTRIRYKARYHMVWNSKGWYRIAQLTSRVGLSGSQGQV